jgi:hypothetical protein
MLFSYDLAKALADAGSDDAALGILEIALSAGGGDDWEYTIFARDLLASIHVKRGNMARAAQQYKLILRQAYRTEFIRRAKAFLDSSASRALSADPGSAGGGGVRESP